MRSRGWRAVAALAVLLALVGLAVAIAALVFSNRLSPAHSGSSGGPAVHSNASGCPAGYGVQDTDVQCEVVIVGAGAGGMFAAFQLRTLLGAKVCVVDNRLEVGGKVQSYPGPPELGEDIFTPTCAEQYRWGDATMRCLAQQMNITAWVRQAGADIETYYNGFNDTSPDIVNSLNSAFWEYAPYVYPNGDTTGVGLRSIVEAPDLCANPHCSMAVDPSVVPGDWTECDPDYEAFSCYTDLNNPALLGDQYARFVDWARAQLNNSMENVRWTNELSYLGELDLEGPARTTAEYLDWDYNVNPLGARSSVVKGGPQQVYLAMRAAMEAAGVRFFMNETATCLDKATDANSTVYPYVVRTDRRNVRAARVVLAMPSGQFIAWVKGTLGASISAQEAMRATGNSSNEGTVNMFFPEKWWLPSRSRINRKTWQYQGGDVGGLTVACAQVNASTGELSCNSTCAYTCNLSLYNTTFQQYVHWSTVSDVAPTFVQYLPTPERQQGNLLRLFYGDNDGHRMRDEYDRHGIAGVERLAMEQLRTRYTDLGDIPDPLKTVFVHEQFAFAHVEGDTTLSLADIRAFAQTPVPGEMISFASEAFDYLNFGWQQAAANMAIQAFYAGGALAGYFDDDTIGNWSVCLSEQPEGTYSHGRQLDLADTDGVWEDPCMHLGNEIDFRDLASDGLFSQACLDAYGTVSLTASSVVAAQAAGTRAPESRPASGGGRVA